MAKYVLDTNVYVDATRNDRRNRELAAFCFAYTPMIYLHSVVAGELLAGSIRPSLARRTQDRFIAPFEVVGRVVTPSHAVWKRAGRLIAALIRDGYMSPTGVKRSFFNDCLIAASARENGFVLITDNLADYELIATYEPIRVVTPWPLEFALETIDDGAR